MQHPSEGKRRDEQSANISDELLKRERIQRQHFDENQVKRVKNIDKAELESGLRNSKLTDEWIERTTRSGKKYEWREVTWQQHGPMNTWHFRIGTDLGRDFTKDFYRIMLTTQVPSPSF
ncbi:unnamed protein product [Caenorhabditis brenneri]